jgi:class 3 adenylate cyclase
VLAAANTEAVPTGGRDAITTKCPNCARAAEPDDRFCGGCGASLSPTCPQCGRSNDAGAAFCTGCGARLGDVKPISREDRRKVSVLFIDMVDFTGYGESTDPERIHTIQHSYFTTVRRIIRQYGGVVEKYIGDAVMALFGAPVTTESDTLRCVRAGLELQRVLTREGRGHEEELRFRVGIATGEALVDLAAARDGGQAIVAGDVVNTAARLQAVAPEGGVLVCAATHAATHRDIEYSERPAVTLRGRSTPSRVWLAVTALLRRPGEDAEPTPMVDREHELKLLVNALHRTMHDRVPQLVTVFGSAGIGKSRLLRELARHAARGDVPVCWRVGHCPPYGENVTYAALADIVKAEAGILDSDDDVTAAERLDQAVRQMADPAAAARLGEALRPLVGLPGVRLTPGETESAWRQFMLAMAARQPTVLVFEDMHWADEAMLRFVELISGSMHRLPLLVVATARRELRVRRPGWTRGVTGAVSAYLAPMNDSDISTMYARMLGELTTSAPTLTPLVELAGGNPLYAHEYVRMLVENGALRPIGPSWTLDTAEPPPMPQTVQAVIANRLDLLDAADRAVLQGAAVVGTQFWSGAVAAAIAAPVAAVERALRRLEQRDLVHEQPTSAMAGEPEYRFRHVLVRDVCYQRLPRAERVARHHRTADWLERVSESRQADLAEVLANHYWAAHEIARTVGLDPAPYAPAARAALHRAARRAYALHALDTAATLVNRALSLKLEPDLGLELFAAELALYRDSDAFLADGGPNQLADLAGQLVAAGDSGGAARAWTLLGTAAWSRADWTETLRCLDRAVSLYAELPDTEDKALALLELARVRMMNAETVRAIDAAGLAAELADRLTLTEVAASARITLATARYMSGSPDGLTELMDVTEHCRTHRLTSRRRAVQNLAWALQEEGDIPASTRLVDEVNTIDRASGHSLFPSFADQFARAYFAGDWTTALRAATASLGRPTAEWDLHLVAVSGWLRVLREEPFGGQSTGDEIDQAVVAARRSGFHRVLRSTLAHAALCRALQGRRDETAQLLAELDENWSQTTMLAFGEWVPAAAHAAALLGPDACARVAGMLKRTPRSTPWVVAGLATVNGAAAGPAAADQHVTAADIYREIGDATNRALALSAAVRALRASGDAERLAPVHAELAEFALRNGAPGLLPR